MNSAVGSFTKSTGAAPANQVAVSGLSFTPTVVFLWTTGNNTAQDSWAVSSKFTFGFATASAGRSVSHAAQDAQGFSNATRNMQNKALSVVQWGEVISAECDLTITSDGFELDWTTNNAVAFHINYLAIDPANASIVDWDHNTTGNKSVTGSGFVPEMVMHLTAWASAHPNTSVDGFFGLGAMTTAAQWAMFVGDADNQNSTISTQCVVDDACIIRQNLTTMALDFRAGYVSMDADGFTVGFSNLSSQRFFSSLCLAGEDYALGVDAKPTSAATVNDSITVPGFEPAAVLLGMQANVTATATGVQHARFGIGASDGTNERAAVNSSQDNIGTSTVDSYMASAKAIVKNNNSTQTIDAEADLAMTATGFDLSWTTNDAVATLVPWIAFGPTGGGGTPATMTVTTATAAAAGEAVTFDAASKLTVAEATAPAAGGTVALTGQGKLAVTVATAPAAGEAVTFDAAALFTIAPATAPAQGEAVNLAAAQAASLEADTATAPAAADGSLTGQGALAVTVATAPAAADGAFTAAALFTIAPAEAPAAGGDVDLLSALLGTLTVTTATAPAAADGAFTAAAKLTADTATAPAAGEAVTFDVAGNLIVAAAGASAAAGDVTFDAAAVFALTPATAPADGGAVGLGAGENAALTVAAATAGAAADGALTGAAILAATVALADAAGGTVDLTGAVAASLTVDTATAPAAAGAVDLRAGVLLHAFAFDMAVTTTSMDIAVTTAQHIITIEAADLALAVRAGG